MEKSPWGSGIRREWETDTAPVGAASVSALLHHCEAITNFMVFQGKFSADFLFPAAEEQHGAAANQDNAHSAEQKISHGAGLGKGEALLVDDVGCLLGFRIRNSFIP